MSAETPRSLVILRHAKADWPQVSDHDRPLAERGRQEAASAGRRIAALESAPELALCSTAVRARETWKLAAPELGRRPRTVYEDRMYEASLGELIALINETPDEVRDLLLVGHNPGMHALADALAGTSEGDAAARMRRTAFPTAALAVVTFDGDWKSVEHGVGALTEYWTPHA
ncbi:SixA phosphatase family protein [Streptomyces polyrhachis]|uniref:SixA phosphatase family protein n=1 Tax=Streptomyces polyrhachis TaxID=1282885 RepID=A0ABW2GL08_9ACTN